MNPAQQLGYVREAAVQYRIARRCLDRAVAEANQSAAAYYTARTEELWHQLMAIINHANPA